MTSTIITTNADALKRAARKISAHPGTLSPNHVLNALSAAIAGPGKNWGFIQGAPGGTYIQPGLSAMPAAAAAPSYILFVEDQAAYPCASRGQALEVFAMLAENAENKTEAETSLLSTGTATLKHPDHAPVRVHLTKTRPGAPKPLHDAPPLRPGVPLTSQIQERLRSLLGQKRSMIISGATGIGKTTLLEQISSGIPQEDKVICIESRPELKLSCKKVHSFEAKNGALRPLLRNATRMKPDWVVLGEIAHPEAFTDLVAIGATGHSILGTMHSGSPADAIRRIFHNLMMECPKRSDEEIREQIVKTGLISVTLHRSAEGQPPRIEAAAIALDEKHEFSFQPIEL